MSASAALLSAGAVALTICALPICAGGCQRAAPTPATISVVTMWPGANPADVEARVGDVVEHALRAVPAIARVDAVASTGASTVIATLKAGTRADDVVADVRARMQRARAALPPSTSAPIVDRVEAGTEPVARVVPRVDHLPLAKGTAILDSFIRPSFEKLDGVARITVDGGAWREVDVDVEAARINALGLDVLDVADAIAKAHAHNLRDVSAVVVAHTSAPVTVLDVASVVEGARHDSTGNALSLVVWRTPDTNANTLRAAIREQLMQAPLPTGYDIDVDDAAPSDAAVVFTAPDRDTALRDARALTAALTQRQIAVDPLPADIPVRAVSIDRARAADAGVDVADAERAVRFAHGGAPVVQLEGVRDVDVRVTLHAQSPADVSVHTQRHALAPVAAFASETLSSQPALLERHDGARAIRVCARIHGDVDAALHSMRAALSATRLSPGVKADVEAGPLLPISPCSAARALLPVSTNNASTTPASTTNASTTNASTTNASTTNANGASTNDASKNDASKNSASSTSAATNKASNDSGMRGKER